MTDEQTLEAVWPRSVKCRGYSSWDVPIFMELREFLMNNIYICKVRGNNITTVLNIATLK